MNDYLVKAREQLQVASEMQGATRDREVRYQAAIAYALVGIFEHFVSENPLDIA